ncbi:MAG: mitochondrial fission ELM1 family protein [Methylohalobius sp.]|nr:mitochondrial fission ELM1 family protein [Methylohalobius sp.]
MQNFSRVWLVIGDKAGDNAQATAVAEALGWPVQQKRLVFQLPYRLGKPKFKPSLYHLDPALSDPLTPPWPELVITIGRRPAMVALWIKRQSGGRTKVVLLGRPKGYFSEFDLVVAPAQYFVPNRPNVLKLTLPLMRIDKQKVEAAALAWEERLKRLPKPLVAVLVGGATKPYRLDAEVARSLLEQALAATRGKGTLYISTSRRTPIEVVQALESYLPQNAKLYRYGLDKPEENPYLALLGLADACIVTGDSISMMVEAICLGKPLAIFPLPLQGGRYLRLKQLLLKWFGGRDLEAFQRLLFTREWAVPLGRGELPYLARMQEIPDEISQVVQRIKALFL